MTLSWHRIVNYTLLIGFALCLFGCGNKDKNGPQAKSDLPDYLDPQKTPSAHRLLSAKDVEKFRVERSKDEILQDVQWRGSFFMTARLQGKEICAVLYRVFSKPTGEEGGEAVFAIFEDDKFMKFVKWQSWQPEDYIEFADKEGDLRRRARPVKIGDYHRLLRYYKSEPLNMKDLEQEVEKQAPTPRQIDPGLTAAVLVLKGLGLFPAVGVSRDTYVRNAKLRHQFNGSRLNIGMSEKEVEAILKADELESGEVQAGTYKIYGSNQSTDMRWPLGFRNLMVVYEDGKLSWICSIESHQGWRKSLKELFIDLSPLDGR